MEHRRKETRTLSPSTCAFAVSVGFLCFAWLTSEQEQVAFLGTLVCFCAGYGFVELQEQKKERRGWDSVFAALPVPFSLATEPLYIKEYIKIVESLTKIVRHDDLLFRDLSRSRVEVIAEDVAILAKGQVIFHATETWRSAYQRVLETMRVKTYYSVAWVRTNDYWNDAPGRQSMRLNYELIERGLRIERVHILPDELWPFDEKMPTGGILEWLVEQAGRGIIVTLVRESDLAKEPDLLRDFAIYGDRAMGIQELDEQSHTVRFILSFDQPSVRQALAQWERLTLFSISFQNLWIDSPPLP
jgi:hypothetical protein